MLEYLTEAIVLEREDLREQDSRITFYTKELGRVSAKATSARKITSRLSSHLEPLNLINLRLVYKNNFQIVDALTLNRFTNWRQSGNLLQVLDLLDFVKNMTADGDSDYQLWALLKATLYSPKIDYNLILKVLGFDHKFANCQICCGKPNYFTVDDLSFYCDDCVNIDPGSPAASGMTIRLSC
ncbi:MAG: DNA repair protein RecO [Patescibacteria group bacterium]